MLAMSALLAMLAMSISHRVAVSPWIRARDPVAGCRIDDHRRRAARDAARRDRLHVVAARLELLHDRVWKVGFEVELIESGRMRPERPVEMQRLHTRPAEGLVE